MPSSFAATGMKGKGQAKVSSKPQRSASAKLKVIRRPRHTHESNLRLKQTSEHTETSSADESSEDENLSRSEQGSGTDIDVDSPRIVQWGADGSDETPHGIDFVDDKREGPSRLIPKLPNDNLSSLSYGRLLKARRLLDEAPVEIDSGNSDGSEDPSESIRITGEGTMYNEGRTQATPKMKRPKKRAHKHAPLEATSKRPVTRRRQVVEVKKVNFRDPRFSPVANDGVQEVFQNHYSFLADMHKAEFKTLKENLKRARDMLRSSPRDQRERREEEVEMLERAYKRSESAVNRDRREAIEHGALEKARKEEKERRTDGKGEWHMKDSAKKELLLKARHDALAGSGGRLAVRKAIDKRQKKISQKEKRRRPAFSGRSSRSTSEGVENRGLSKRRKIA